MNADDIFGIIVLLVSILGVLFFMVAYLKKEMITSKIKSKRIKNR